MLIKNLVFSLILISPAFSVLAATEISRSDTDKYLKTGVVAISGKDIAESALAALNDKVSAASAEFFHVTRLGTPGDSSKWSANATLYKSR